MSSSIKLRMNPVQRANQSRFPRSCGVTWICSVIIHIVHAFGFKICDQDLEFCVAE